MRIPVVLAIRHQMEKTQWLKLFHGLQQLTFVQFGVFSF